MAEVQSGVVRSLRSYRLVIGLMLAGETAFGLAIVLGYSLLDKPQPHFGTEVAKATLALGTGLILGGALKAMLDRYQEVQKQRAEDHERVQKQREEDDELRERLLAELRDVHDRAEGARLMIAAHKSVETYAAQMRSLIGCQVVLLKVKRTLELRPDSTRGVDQGGMCLANMIGYLRALLDEYTQHYCHLVECERYDRALTRHRLRGLAAQDASPDTHAGAASRHAWDIVDKSAFFPVLNDLTDCGDVYVARFRQPLHVLAAQLVKGRSRKFDTEFDKRVTAVVEQIDSELGVKHDAIWHGSDSGPDDFASG
jgi:hypothetical protein